MTLHRVARCGSLALLMFGSSTMAMAQATTNAPDESERLFKGDAIVVTGSAVPVEQYKLGNVITVLSAEEIEQKNPAYLQDLLREIPGVSVNQAGSFGSITQVRIRGAEANHVLVLVDGVEVSSVGTGEFDFSSMLASNIERVEVLRGRQSGLYGSNALAGVINVITKGGEGPVLDAAVEAGSYGSWLGRAAMTVGDRDTYGTISAAFRSTDGFSTAAIGDEADGDDNVTLYTRGGVKLSDAVRLDGNLRFVNKKSQTDGFDFSGGETQGLAIDDDSFSNTEDVSGSVSLTLEPVDRWVSVFTAAYSWGEMEGGYGKLGTWGSEGDRIKFSGKSSYSFDTPSFANATHSITVFADHEEENYRNTYPADASQVPTQSRELFGYGLEYRLDLANNLYLKGAVRHDENDNFADVTTFSTTASWVLPNKSTRFHASYGTGVTNPTFTEQFGYTPGTFVGNPDLLPEKARGFDIGVEQRLLDNRLLLDLTYFNSTLEDEIVSLYPSVVNDTGESDRQGVEFTARVDLGVINFGGSYTYLDATDPDGSREVRRPEHQASFDIGGAFGPEKRGQINAGLIYNGEMLDTDYRNYYSNGYMAEKGRVDSYTVLRISGSYRITDMIELFARVENLLDESYEEAISYASPGLSAYGGIRLTLN